MEDINKLLGLRIKSLREGRQQTQSDLAASINLSLKNLGELERGRGNPSLRSLVSIAQGLDVTLSELFDFEPYKDAVALRQEISTRLQTAKPEVLNVIHINGSTYCLTDRTIGNNSHKRFKRPQRGKCSIIDAPSNKALKP
jgi:transcriptional regulator with XRE-family HTH domain